MAASEGVDLNAKLHGGWTLENGKAKLNEFCQQNKLQMPQIMFRNAGQDQQSGFLAEIYLYIPKLHRKLYASSRGSNKKTAGTSTALSIGMKIIKMLFKN